MNRIYLLFTVFLYLAVISCDSRKSTSSTSDKKSIVVSILPMATFVEKITDDDFNIHVLLPPGATPVDFTLSPSQIKIISDSDIWFRIGHIGFEYSWKEKIMEINREMAVVDLSEDLDLIRDEFSELAKSGSSMPAVGVNPHTWLSPMLVKQMSFQIMNTLLTMHPQNRERYQKNFENFSVEIDSLYDQIKTSFLKYQGCQFITFHPSLSYFARDFGLIQHSLEPGGKEPTPQRIAEVMELAEKEDIRIIYIQSDLDREQARVFAEEVNGEIIQIQPLNPDWGANLLDITQKLIDHF